MRILYVEDNLTNVYLVKRIAVGHEVINYIDGEEALKRFEQDQPDLVLMDIQLAGRLNGLEVVQQLRERRHTIPIVAVTAYAMVGDREKCLAAGCDDYMAKPLAIPQVLELIQKYAPKDEATTEEPTPDTEASNQTSETQTPQSDTTQTKTSRSLD